MFNSKLKSFFRIGSLDTPKDLTKHFEVPKLMVAFDTESTGLNTKIGYDKYQKRDIKKEDLDEPISYGLVVYRDGVHRPEENQHFLVKPQQKINPAAQAVHGWSAENLEASHNGHYFKMEPNGFYMPALDPKIGVNKIANLLSDYQKQGAVIVGANHKNYDMSLLKNTYMKYNNGMPLHSSGFNPSSAKMIDVIEHDRAIDPGYPSNHPQYRSRSLTNLCQHYGVDPGGHKALDDARASADVLLKQIEFNKKKGSL